MNTNNQLPQRSVALIVLLVTLLAGIFAGVAVDRVMLPRPPVSVLADTGFHRLSAVLRAPTDAERAEVRAHLASELRMTPAQALIVDSILDAHSGGFSALREEIRPRVESLTAAVRADVERVLTPDQVAAYRRLLGVTTNVRGDST